MLSDDDSSYACVWSYAFPPDECFIRCAVFFHVGHSVLIEEGQGYGHSLSHLSRDRQIPFFKRIYPDLDVILRAICP